MSARPGEAAAMSADAPRAAIVATAGLLIVHSTRAGVFPDRVATTIWRCSRMAIVKDEG
jgi:hypothetical protein